MVARVLADPDYPFQFPARMRSVRSPGRLDRDPFGVGNNLADHLRVVVARIDVTEVGKRAEIRIIDRLHQLQHNVGVRRSASVVFDDDAEARLLRVTEETMKTLSRAADQIGVLLPILTGPAHVAADRVT